MASEEAALRKLRAVLRGAPKAALKAARSEAGLSQSQVAREAGIAQTQYADIERGTRNLTPAMAKRLAAALKNAASFAGVPGVGIETGPQLEQAHLVSGVKRLAADDPDALTPEVLVQLIAWLDARLPETEGAGALLDALLGLLKARIATYEATRKAERKQAAQVATKSARRAPDRDPFGRRRNKPGRPRL